MSDATKPILAVSDLWVTFPAYRREPVRALKGIDLRIDGGEFIGLVGESGAGKTMLARAVMGLVPAPGVIERGQVLFDGRDLSKLDDRAGSSTRSFRWAVRSRTSRIIIWASAAQRATGWRSRSCARCGFPTRSTASARTRTNSAAAWHNGWPSPWR